MPVLTSLGWCIWLTKIAAQLALVLILLRGRHWRTWPALTAFVGWCTAVALALLGLTIYDHATGCQGDTIPRIYFDLYWLGAAVAYALELWLILEIARAVCPVMSRWLIRVIPAMALVFLLGSLMLGPDAPGFALLETRLVVILGRGVALAWLGTFVMVGWSSEAVGLHWRRRELRVSMGLTVLLVGEVLTRLALGIFPQHSMNISMFSGVTFVISLLVWARAFLSKNGAPDSAIPLDVLRRAQNALTATGEGLRAK